jgi:hypothetical protein
MIVKVIKNEIKHQDIGGKEFIVDEYITETLSPEEIFRQAAMGNIACNNFIIRRPDFDHNFEHKLYYGKVNGLDYIVAEDEFKKGE